MKKSIIIFLISCLMVSYSFPAFSLTTVIIEGVIKEHYKIELNSGVIYSLGINSKGLKLSTLIGKRVKITGSLVEITNDPTILVLDYTINQPEKMSSKRVIK